MDFTGIERIMAEREKQLYRGYDAEHDDLKENEGVLLHAALFLLTNDEQHFPEQWDNKTKRRMSELPREEQVIRAGALCAAYYDQLQRKKVSKEINGQHDTGELTNTGAEDKETV